MIEQINGKEYKPFVQKIPNNMYMYSALKEGDPDTHNKFGLR